MKKPDHYRQGDVLLVRVNSIPKSAAKKLKPKNGRLIVMEGEATGHHHSFPSSSCAVLEDPATRERFVHVTEESDFTHQEHGTIRMEPGIYQQFIQVEEIGDAITQVAD